ncbi:hypothetical protein CDV31_017187 [Fusarium ambrosium]|uniref:Clr5 domain-containing protein n=1 Tax=Fusarium ambrosium TaxID=131363 RepID=A0A428RQA1_9HYPO|nr:hypothetical protein CDV31_017187 [Fusarium ambrosium]
MTAKPWNEHRGTIAKLYIQEGRTLKDVRGIMKTEYNFEASIRSYLAYFDSWGIGKYNCKKRQQRRHRSSNATLLGPPRSPSAVTSSPETSGPGSLQFSSRASLCSSGQQPPLPAIQQSPQHTPSLRAPELYTKMEKRGKETGWGDAPIYSLHPRLSFVVGKGNPLTTPQGGTPAWPGCPPSMFPSHSSRDHQQPSTPWMPKFSHHSETASDLRAPIISVVRQNGGRGVLDAPSQSHRKPPSGSFHGMTAVRHAQPYVRDFRRAPCNYMAH